MATMFGADLGDVRKALNKGDIQGALHETIKLRGTFSENFSKTEKEIVRIRQFFVQYRFKVEDMEKNIVKKNLVTAKKSLEEAESNIKAMIKITQSLLKTEKAEA